MSNDTEFIRVLEGAAGPVCDDCLAPAAGWNQRQQANQVGRRLAERGAVRRTRGACVMCGKTKTVSVIGADPPSGPAATDTPERPRAFISHAAALQDSAVAERLEFALRAVGFHVAVSGSAATGARRARGDDEPTMFQSHALVPIVSHAYLTHPECLNELSGCRARAEKAEVPLFPVIIEPLDVHGLDPYARWALEGLARHGGFVKARPPADTDLQEIAEGLVREVAARGVWTPPTAVEPPPSRVREAVPLRTKRVFISHAKEDRAAARSVCLALEEQGIPCWMAPRDILPGRHYGRAVIEGLAACRILLLLYSSRSNVSEHVAKEVERATSRRLVVIPFRLEDVPLSPDLEYYLSSPQWLDALTPPLDSHLERLADVVREQLRLLDDERDATPENTRSV